MNFLCGKPCSHGGVCQLDKDHDGAHSTGYCTWEGDSGVTMQEANDMVRINFNKLGFTNEQAEFVIAVTTEEH